MLLERVDPFLAEFDRLAQRAFGATDGVGLPMDVIRRDEQLVVVVDLPGVPESEITVTVENRVLMISAERRATYREGDTLLFQERFDGAINRRLRIPDWVDVDAVTAEHNDGVLAITLPLADRAKPRRICVTNASEQPVLETTES
jgi:HSP20 family protein